MNTIQNKMSTTEWIVMTADSSGTRFGTVRADGADSPTCYKELTVHNPMRRSFSKYIGGMRSGLDTKELLDDGENCHLIAIKMRELFGVNDNSVRPCLFVVPFCKWKHSEKITYEKSVQEWTDGGYELLSETKYNSKEQTDAELDLQKCIWPNGAPYHYGVWTSWPELVERHFFHPKGFITLFLNGDPSTFYERGCDWLQKKKWLDTKLPDFTVHNWIYYGWSEEGSELKYEDFLIPE